MQFVYRGGTIGRMDIKIDKGVPIPPPFIGVARYPWRTMEIGDSFLYPLRPGKEMQALRRDASAHAASTGKRIGRKFRLRTLEGEAGVRVWRIE